MHNAVYAISIYSLFCSLPAYAHNNIATNAPATTNPPLTAFTTPAFVVCAGGLVTVELGPRLVVLVSVKLELFVGNKEAVAVVLVTIEVVLATTESLVVVLVAVGSGV